MEQEIREVQQISWHWNRDGTTPVHLQRYITMLRLHRGVIGQDVEFNHVNASIPGTHTVELLARVRDTGRVMGDTRLVLGGTDILEVNIRIQDAIPSPRLAGWRLKYQVWPRDITLRPNMSSSAWMDLEAMVTGRDAEVTDEQGTGIPPNEFLGVLEGLPDPKSAATRWAVVCGDDGGIHLQLQALPATAAVLSAKPVLRK